MPKSRKEGYGRGGMKKKTSTTKGRKKKGSRRGK